MEKGAGHMGIRQPRQTNYGAVQQSGYGQQQSGTVMTGEGNGYGERRTHTKKSNAIPKKT